MRLRCPIWRGIHINAGSLPGAKTSWRKSAWLDPRVVHWVPRSISDPQQVFPLLKVALEAHAFGDLKGRDDARLDLLAGLPGAPISHDGEKDGDSSAVLSFEVSDGLCFSD
jgi:hypothetical protein